MKPVSLKGRLMGRSLADLLTAAAIVLLIFGSGTPGYAQRVKGLDTSSAANTSAPSQSQWNSAFSQGYRFAFVRSSRGGTSDSTHLEDAHFYDNITRATTAGLLAGSYHYARPDVTTHTAADDANHYLQHAGMYMKPGYLLPVFDLEAGNTQHSLASLTAWSMEFVNTIHNAKGVYPIVYVNSSYANDEVGAELAWHNFGTTPKSDPRTFQWLSRPGGDGLTGDPPPAQHYPNPYGVWDPNFVTRTNSREPAVKPWVFWQQTLNVTPTGLFKIDINYANGNIEFVKDFLVPALWTNPGSGDWENISNWNSDNPGYNGTIQSGPAPRLPNNASLDWVRLQHSGGGTVTLSSGARNIRKFYTQQPLNITGGSLNVAYVPGSGGKWDLPSEFAAAVTLSGSGAYSAHTTQINGGGGVLILNGGTVTFTEIKLASHASNSAKVVMNGSVTFGQTGGSATSVIRSTGTLAQAGSVTLSAGAHTFNVNNGSAGVDLNVRAPMTGSGRFIKSGPGTMQLAAANSYNGGTTISGGVLQLAADNRLGAAPGSVQPDNIILNGGTLRTGAEITSVSLTSAGVGYTSFPTLTIGGAGASAHAASANVLAGIRSIDVTTGGSNYGPGAFVDIVGGGGSGAAATATVVNGVVTAITVTNPGSGYTSLPTIFISGPRDTTQTSPSYGYAGSGATAQVSGITLQGVALNDGGFDYTSPTITLTGGGGTGATASATASPSLTLNSNRGLTLTTAGGTLHQTAGTTFTIPGPISSSGSGMLTKSGPGALVLSGANLYTGGTSVIGGRLTVSGGAASLGTGDVTVQGTGSALTIESGVDNAIHDQATLSLFGGGTTGIADQGYAQLGNGINEVIGALLLNGILQPSGTYGSSISSAVYKLDEYFAGAGMLTVGLPGDYNGDNAVNAADYVLWRKQEPASPDGYAAWRANFGSTIGSGAATGGEAANAAVPEPTTIALLVLALAGLVSRRCGR